MSDYESKPYVYEPPVSKGYTAVHLSRSALQAANVRDRYKFNAGYTACFFHPKHGFYFEHLPRTWLKVLCVLFFPLSLLLYGPMNIREIAHDFRRVLRPRRYGSFVSDRVHPKCSGYELLLSEVRDQVHPIA